MARVEAGSPVSPSFVSLQPAAFEFEQIWQMPMGVTFSRLLDRVVNVMAFLAGVLLLFQVVSVSFDVTVRYFFDTSIRAVISLNEWSLLYIAFLGAPWLQTKAGHVSVDIFLIALRGRARKAFELFGVILGIGTCLVLVWYGTSVSWAKFDQNAYDFFKLREIPVWPIYVVIPLGSLLWLLVLIREAFRRLTGADAYSTSPSDQPSEL